MSVTEEQMAKVIWEHGDISTNMEIRPGRRVYLVAGKDGLVRQIKGTVADPRVDPDVADFLRGIRGWRVGTWPAGYEPDEQVIRVPEGTIPPTAPVGGEEVAREAMLSQMRFIGRPRGQRGSIPTFAEPEEAEAERPQASLPPSPAAPQEPDLADTERISELMAEVTVLTGTVLTKEAQIAELEARVRKLEARIDQQGRVVVPATPPKDGSDGVDRAAPTAEDLGKGPNLDPKNSKRNRGRKAESDSDVPPIAGATAGIPRA